MATNKLTSRQKMINMMYLVLIAMLVLNVDKRVLKSFHTMEVNNIGASSALSTKNASLLQQFSKILDNDEVKARPYYGRALEAQEISKEFNEYVEKLKKEIEEMYGGRLEQEAGQSLLTALKTPDQFEKHSNYFMVADRGSKALGLQQKINSTRDELLKLLDVDQDSLFKSLNAKNAAIKANQLNANDPESDGPVNVSWAQENLEELPSGALMAMLSQLQSNAKLLESDVISRLMTAVHSSDYTFNELNAHVIPKSNYVMQGENYEADIILVASNTTSNPTFVVNGESLTTIENGVGKLSIPAQGIGVKEYSGQIQILNPSSNELETFSFNQSYQVFSPVATVAPEAMNLFYVGLDNPVSISVPGFSAADISVSASSGARISGSNGQYMVKVDGSSRTVKINVTAGGRSMGTTSFRVRNVPAPRPQWGGIPNDGRGVNHVQASAQTHLLASLGEDFAYDMNWKVTSYRYILVRKNGPLVDERVNGSAIPSSLKQLLRSAKRGDILLIQDIRGRDSQYGIEKDISPLTLNLI